MTRARDIAALLTAASTLATDVETAAAITSHSSATDPHGDRSYTTTSISTHSSASDPHGDRSAATNAISTHNSATTSVHGISNTALLATISYSDLSIQESKVLQIMGAI